ncbi:MAG: tetratricopeptide repeat protein [Bacteroidetes bacterium]|nr:MAG: tetratricopeptide repeat protein [Bacteroidota bacterium]
MKCSASHRQLIIITLLCCIPAMVTAQANIGRKVKRASGKIESGIKKNNPDTLAGGYFDLGESYYQNGEMGKAETYYQKAKSLFEKMDDAAGIAKSSRALAKVQEDLKKNKEALGNYNTARDNSQKTGDITLNTLNGNDISRLSKPDSVLLQERLIQSNIDLGIKKGDTGEIVTNFSRMGELNLKYKKTTGAINAFKQAYQFSINNPGQAMKFNDIITDVYLQNKNFSKAIETKKDFLGQGYVQSSSQLKAREITSLADIYIQKKEDTTAIQLLNESYDLSVKNGHTLEARTSIERLDSIFQSKGRRDLSLQLYKNFLQQLPAIIARDSSIADNRIVAETETRVRQLETEKNLKDDLIRRKNNFNYWLIAFIGILVVFIAIILNMVKKLRLRNKKIALQSLRREMNPHFIFNSLNSINQFIANNNELEANRYLTKFSTLMRRVMENSKEDFVLFSQEIDLLRNYLELEKSRFDDKFDFSIEIDDPLFADERLYIPTMLVQPHLENAIWHGLRYIADKGFLKLSFTRTGPGVEIVIEDNGIGIAASKDSKTANQKKHSGRGITNTMERISILNEVYHQNIICEVEDKMAPDRGVRVKIIVPVLKDFKA